MGSVYAKGVRSILICVCTVASAVVSGCALGEHHGHGDKGDNVSSEQLLVMQLAERPEYQPLLTGKPQTCGMRSGRVYLLPGQSIGQHSTEAHEEMLVFLSGKGTAIIGEEGTSFEVGQGRICYIPPYTVHNMKNTGTGPFVYIYCVSPITGSSQRHE